MKYIRKLSITTPHDKKFKRTSSTYVPFQICKSSEEQNKNNKKTKIRKES